ncbi:UNVERIFIED_CONTAM: hypothetical protein FKN15_076242 [Acipenser sinensis]
MNTAGLKGIHLGEGAPEQGKLDTTVWDREWIKALYRREYKMLHRDVDLQWAEGEASTQLENQRDGRRHSRAWSDADTMLELGMFSLLTTPPSARLGKMAGRVNMHPFGRDCSRAQLPADAVLETGTFSLPVRAYSEPLRGTTGVQPKNYSPLYERHTQGQQQQYEVLESGNQTVREMREKVRTALIEMRVRKNPVTNKTKAIDNCTVSEMKKNASPPLDERRELATVRAYQRQPCREESAWETHPLSAMRTSKNQPPSEMQGKEQPQQGTVNAATSSATIDAPTKIPTQPLLLSSGPQPKMLRYNGIMSLEAFITQCDLIAEAHAWPELYDLA